MNIYVAAMSYRSFACDYRLTWVGNIEANGLRPRGISSQRSGTDPELPVSQWIERFLGHVTSNFPEHLMWNANLVDFVLKELKQKTF